MRILLTNVRIAFANGLWEAKAVQDSKSKPKFSCTALIDRGDEKQRKMVEDASRKVANEKWLAKGPEIYKALEKQDRLAMHDGETKPDYEGRSEEHTSELQSHHDIVCRLLLEK